MKFDSLTVREFLSELGNGTPVPGGGSVAALCGALAAALSTMVARLTLGREKYRDAWDEMGKAEIEGEELKERLLALTQEDSDAYLRVIEAFRLPRGTDVEKAARAEAIQEAGKNAARVPLETLRVSETVLALARTVLEKGNPGAITDAGAAAHLARAAAQVAAANVRINLPSIRDEAFVRQIREEAREALERVETCFGEASRYLESSLP